MRSMGYIDFSWGPPIRNAVYLTLLGLAFLFAPRLSRAETINIWAGHPLDGFGDVATNLLLAQQIKSLRPKATINLIVSDDVANNYLPILLPQFSADSRGIQTVDGIRFIRSDSRIPKAEFYLEFSAKRSPPGGLEDVIPPVPDRVLRSAPVRLLFSELGTEEHLHLDRKERDLGAPMVESSSFSNIPGLEFRVLTGASPNEAGLYLSPQKPVAKLSRSNLLEQIATTQEKPIPTGDQLAFCYAAEVSSAEKYVSALTRVAQGKDWQRKPITILSNQKLDASFTSQLPSWVKVIHTPRLPFSLTQEIINQADFPPMVTGSVSLSLAMSAEKPFVYESTTWKHGLVEGLSEILAPHTASQDSPRLLDMLSASHYTERQGAEGPVSVSRLAGLMRDRDLHVRVSETLGKIKPGQCLACNIDHFLSLASDVDLEQLTAGQLESVFKSAKRGLSLSETHQRMRKAKPKRKAAATKKTASPRKLAQTLLKMAPEQAVAFLQKMEATQRRIYLETLQSEVEGEERFRLILKELAQAADPALNRQLGGIAYCREILIQFGNRSQKPPRTQTD